jgi:NADP-dependent 3-hydroxy acid dehydrogenase YdfG
MNEASNTLRPPKSIFVTGAAAGIGRSVAELFHRRGWHVGIAGRDAARLESLREALGGERCSCHVLDVADQASVSRAMAAFGEITGQQMHVLVNNAGVLHSGHFEDIGLEDHHRIVDTNVKGVLNCAHAAFPLLRNTRRSCVINMSSASAMFGSPSIASYSATKFAVRGLTEALNVEWTRHDIRVCDVMPPFVDTGMLDPATRSRIKAISYLGVNLTAEDVAQQVWNVAHTREFFTSKMHARMTLPFKLIALGQKHSPERIQRRVVKFLSGY